MDKKTCFEILGLDYGADLQEIKKAYRKLSTKFHPDKNKGDEYFTKMYLKIKEAYDFLNSDIDQKDSKKNKSSDSSFEEVYLELRELKFKLGGGTKFEDLEELIHDRITNELLTLSEQDKLLKTKNSELIGKIVNEVYIIFAYIRDDYYYNRLSTIIMNLSNSNPLYAFSIQKALNMKLMGLHGNLIIKK